MDFLDELLDLVMKLALEVLLVAIAALLVLGVVVLFQVVLRR